MKIIELEIRNVRGIKHLVLKPEGRSFAVAGPNGSGKSAVVDAIDFLLTGKVQRLSGKGTIGLSLKQHGPHIDSEPKEATVRAIIEVGGAGRFEVSRCMSAPDSLVIPPEKEGFLRQVTELAARGQHVLSRREILKDIMPKLRHAPMRSRPFSI